MSSPAQIEANRLNALKSTGPKSDDGKARSAMNALKSGLDAQSPIIPGESPEAFAQLRDEYYAAYIPTDPEQRFYLDTAIVCEWDLRRFQRIEEQIWANAASHVEAPIAGLELGQALRQDDKTIMRLHRRVAHARKSYRQAMDTFRRLQTAKTPPQHTETMPPLPKLGSFQPSEYSGPSDPFLDALTAHLHQIEIVANAPEVPEPAPDPEDDAAA